MQGHTTEIPLPQSYFNKIGPLLSLKGLLSVQNNVSHWYIHLCKSCLH